MTLSTYVGNSSGIAIDYRRGFSKNREIVLGGNTSFNGAGNLSLGFRKYYKTENKLSVGFGADARLKNRNIIGDNFFTRNIERTLYKVDYGQIRFVSGLYYKVDDRFNVMAEAHLSPIWNRRGRSLKVGLKYKF